MKKRKNQENEEKLKTACFNSLYLLVLDNVMKFTKDFLVPESSVTSPLSRLVYPHYYTSFPDRWLMPSPEAIVALTRQTKIFQTVNTIGRHQRHHYGDHQYHQQQRHHSRRHRRTINASKVFLYSNQMVPFFVVALCSSGDATCLLGHH